MIMEYSYYKKMLIQAMKKIRKPMASIRPDYNATYIYFQKTLLPPINSHGFRENYMMPFLILVTNPCSHILKCGGCTMCGYSNLAIFDRLNGEHIYEQFRRGLKVLTKIPHHEMIAIGTAGSFLDPNEVPFDIQAKIIEELNSMKDIYYINIESRAEYITDKSLKNLVEVVNDPYKLSIGVGLESINELIRELSVNKCMSLDLFIKSMKLLKKYNISPTAYITIGKPFIDTWTNIKDAVDSIKSAFQNGADRVVLLRIGVQPNSLIEWLYKRGMYKPISIFALIEVLKRIPEEIRENVLIADPRLPRYLEINEHPCDQTAKELLNEYSGCLNFKYIKAIEAISCEYKKEWYKKLEVEMDNNRTIEEQIYSNYEKWLEVWKNEYGELL